MAVTGEIHPKATYVLGVDFARLGEDSSVYTVLEKPWGEEKVYVVYIHEQKHSLLNQAVGFIKRLDQKFRFKMIYTDETGLGSGPTDFLKESLGRRIKGFRFTLQSKQDLYSNLKRLMEAGLLRIPNHRKLLFQLADLRYELTSTGEAKIHHSERGYDDMCDSLALACLYFQSKPRTVYHIG